MDHFDRISKLPCMHKTHKRQSISSRNKTVTSSDDRFISKVLSSPSKIPKNIISQELIAENEKLKRENEVLQEYFETFQEKYREQRKENETLKKLLK